MFIQFEICNVGNGTGKDTDGKAFSVTTDTAYVNTKMITFIKELKLAVGTFTRIWLADGLSVYVEKSIDEVIDIINNA